MDDQQTGYGQYCPISRAVEVLGERWSMLIVRDMLVGATRFNELSRCNPGLSRGLLVKRLRQLEAAGLVEHVGEDYLLTEAGEDLRSIVFGLGEWGAKWTFKDPDPAEMDPVLLAWWMHNRFDTSVLPDAPRTVFHLRLKDDPKLFWFVIEQGTPSVCLSDPGFEVDVTISADLADLYRIWLGRLPMKQAIRNGLIEFTGPANVTRCMPQVMQLSPVAAIVAANPSRR